MSDHEILAHLERLQTLTEQLMAQCDARLAQVTAIAADLEPIVAAHSAMMSLPDSNAEAAQATQPLSDFETSTIESLIADAKQQSQALQTALAGASQWQIDLVAQKSALEAIASDVAAQAVQVMATASEVQENLAVSDQVSQTILERLASYDPGAEPTAQSLPPDTDLAARLAALETALPTTATWHEQLEASVQELQAFLGTLEAQREAIQTLVREGTAQLNSQIVRGQTQIADVVGGQQEHLSALITEASQRAEQAQTLMHQAETILPQLQQLQAEATAVLTQLAPLSAQATTQLEQFAALPVLDLGASSEVATLLSRLEAERPALEALLVQHTTHTAEAHTHFQSAIDGLAQTAEADLSARLFALSEAAIANVQEALEAMNGTTPNSPLELQALLSQVTDVQERLFAQQQNFSTQLETSTQVQNGLEAQLQQWQSFCATVDLTAIAYRLETLETLASTIETTAAQINAAAATSEANHAAILAQPSPNSDLAERLAALEQQAPAPDWQVLQTTVASLSDRTAALQSQLEPLQAQHVDVGAELATLQQRYQALSELPTPPDYTSDLAALQSRYQDLSDRYTSLEAQLQAAPAVNPELEALRTLNQSLAERCSALEAAIASPPATNTDDLQAAYQALNDKLNAIEQILAAPTASAETVPAAEFAALQTAHNDLNTRYATLQSSQNTLIEATKVLLKRVRLLESKA